MNYVTKFAKDKFTEEMLPTSDINWSASVAEIDRQLYKKYNLSEEEIAFIETKVKHNLRLLDSLEYAKSETLEAKLEEIFG